jgi:hypothetical protein
VTVNADSIVIPAGGSIFIAPNSEYVLIGASQQAALAAIGSQPMTTRALCIGGGC